MRTAATLLAEALLSVPCPDKPEGKRARFYTGSESWQPLPRVRRYQVVAMSSATWNDILSTLYELCKRHPGLRFQSKDGCSYENQPVLSRLVIVFPLDFDTADADALLKKLATAGAEVATAGTVKEDNEDEVEIISL